VNGKVAIERSLEGKHAVELQRDEDILSPEMQRELEAVGTALAVIGVFALLAASLPRAKRLLELTPFAKERRDG
jgi:hypothetical protein